MLWLESIYSRVAVYYFYTTVKLVLSELHCNDRLPHVMWNRCLCLKGPVLYIKHVRFDCVLLHTRCLFGHTHTHAVHVSYYYVLMYTGINWYRQV